MVSASHEARNRSSRFGGISQRRDAIQRWNSREWGGSGRGCSSKGFGVHPRGSRGL